MSTPAQQQVLACQNQIQSYQTQYTNLSNTISFQQTQQQNDLQVIQNQVAAIQDVIAKNSADIATKTQLQNQYQMQHIALQAQLTVLNNQIADYQQKITDLNTIINAQSIQLYDCQSKQGLTTPKQEYIAASIISGIAIIAGIVTA